MPGAKAGPMAAATGAYTIGVVADLNPMLVLLFGSTLVWVAWFQHALS